MKTGDFEIKLIEADDSKEEFDGIRMWNLRKPADTKDHYERMEEDEKNGIGYQEIPTQIVDNLNGITNQLLKEKLNGGHCFSFDYTPEESDKLIFFGPMQGRAITIIPFSFQKDQWHIDDTDEGVIIKGSRSGVIEIKYK